MLAACSPDRTPQEVPVPANWALLAPEVRQSVEAAVERCRKEGGSAAAFAQLGRVYHGNHQPALAEQAYERALALDASDVRTIYFLALVHEERGDSARALERLEQARALDPKYALIPYHVGVVQLEAGRTAPAIAAFEEAARLDPGNVPALVGLARALRQSGKLPEALAAVQQALAKDPDHLGANQVAALILSAQGRPDAAGKHLAKVRTHHAEIVRDPWFLEVQALGASVEGILAKAEYFFESRKPEGAIRLLEPAAKANPGRADVHRALGRAFSLAAQFPGARDAYAKAVAIEPQDARTRADLAMVLLDLGDLDGARREAQSAAAIDSGMLDAQVVVAAVKLRTGDPSGALAAITPVVAARADLVLAQIVLGDALLALRRADEAASAFEAALRLSPGIPYAKTRLADARRAAGRTTESR